MSSVRLVCGVDIRSWASTVPALLGTGDTAVSMSSDGQDLMVLPGRWGDVLGSPDPICNTGGAARVED